MAANQGDSLGGEPREPNPTAIAWYVEEAQRLLEEQQRRAESLRVRGGQIAGFGAAVLVLIGGNVAELPVALDGFGGAIVGVAFCGASLLLTCAVAIAIWGSLRPKIFGSISAHEVAIYTSERLLDEPDLWRVHVRSLHALGDAMAEVRKAGDSAARAIEWSLRAFLFGLAFSSISITTLIAEVI